MSGTTPERWRKSTHSSNNGGDCVEVAEFTHVRWRKSTHSSDNGGDCVEVADGFAAVPVRDSKAPALGHLAITPASWSALLATLRTA